MINSRQMIDFLMEHDIFITHMHNGRYMTADESMVIGGQLVVIETHNPEDLYRGTNFDEALKTLEDE